jgi:hypothetical protein
MRGAPAGNGCCQQLRLGTLAAFLLAVGGLALLSQALTQAGGPPFSPQAVAFFPNNEKLHVAVTAPGDEPLSVELLGADGKRVANGKQAGPRFELSADKAKADTYTLRVRQGQRRQDIPLKNVLLVKAHETSLVCGQEFFAGSTTALRLSVHGVRSVTETAPLPGAQAIIRLRGTAKDAKPRELYSGKVRGETTVALPIPAVETGAYVLEVSTRSALGEEKLERQVRVKSEAKILLVSDRPIYQPGHVIHLRALALRPFDLKPIAKADLLFEVEDAKGNKVFKRTLKTSDFGIAAVDFQLADEVNMGDYQLKAALGEHRTQKTVTVKRYVLPKFKVQVTTDKRFYLPKEKVSGSLQVDYFFGKPVAGGQVEITAETFDVAFRKFQTWNGKTDANGHVKFDIQLPDYFVGQPLQKGNALVKLDVKVTDSADHTEKVSRTYNVSDQPIRVSLIPEGGRLVPGLKNRVFAAAVYPDGSPAPCDVKLWLGKEAKGEPLAALKTNDAGLAEFRFTPQAAQFRADGNNEPRNVELLGGQVIQTWAPKLLLDVRAEARDRKGNAATAVAALNSQPLGENVLLRLDKAVYQGGDAMRADISTSAGLPTAYVDVIRGGQVLLSRWLEVKDGAAGARIDLPQTAFGTLEIHAYQMLASGEIIRDSRVAYVQPRDDLKIKVKAEKAEYQPGENGRIRFEVTDRQGRPTAAALGVIVVDEAVYALQDMQPGLEKVYFTLQEELLKPQVQIEYKPSDTINNLVREPALPADKQQVAEVLLTAVRPRPPARWEVAPDVQRKNLYESRVQQIGWGLYQYAWYNDKFIERDDAGQWHFRPDLVKADVLQELVRRGHVAPASLDSPLGGKLTLKELERTEKGFSLDNLTRAITHQRLQALAAAFIRYTNANKAKFFKDGRWTFPAAALGEAARHEGLSEPCLVDVWGQGFKLVARKGVNRTGHAQFDAYDIASAGPDRDYETADDIRWTAVANAKVGGWWASGGQSVRVTLMHPQLQRLEELTRLGALRNGFRNRGLGAGREALRLGDGNFGGRGRGGFGPQGMPVPGMAPVKSEAAPRRAPTDAKGGPGHDPQSGQGQGGTAPVTRLREYFPETMLWQPALITDDKGVAHLAVNFADSITTWRLSASASSRGGALGGVNVPLKVFQDFFVDIDLPVALTQNDEVAFPVAVYNYLKTPQTVKIELQAEPWFSLIDQGGLTRKLDLKPNEVTAVKFRIRANKVGWQPLTLKAHGTKMSDAVKRVVEVVPDGQKVERVVNDRLTGRVVQDINIPPGAVPDASKLIVRIYPGVVAQVMDGMEGMIRLPGG